MVWKVCKQGGNDGVTQPRSQGGKQPPEAGRVQEEFSLEADYTSEMPDL